MNSRIGSRPSLPSAALFTGRIGHQAAAGRASMRIRLSPDQAHLSQPRESGTRHDPLLPLKTAAAQELLLHFTSAHIGNSDYSRLNHATKHAMSEAEIFAALNHPSLFRHRDMQMRQAAFRMVSPATPSAVDNLKTIIRTMALGKLRQGQIQKRDFYAVNRYLNAAQTMEGIHAALRLPQMTGYDNMLLRRRAETG